MSADDRRPTATVVIDPEVRGPWGEALLPDFKAAYRLIRMSPDDIERHLRSLPQLALAEEFAETIEPEDGVDYDWAWDYANDKFARIERIYKDLDDKASDIIKYLGGGTGLFTLGALAATNSGNVLVITFAVPSFLLAIISIALAARARQPCPAGEPSPVRTAYLYANQYRKASLAKGAFLGQWNVACDRMFFAMQGKALRIDHATKFHVWTLILLILPIAAALWSA